MYGGLNETPRPYWAPAGGSLVSELQRQFLRGYKKTGESVRAIYPNR